MTRKTKNIIGIALAAAGVYFIYRYFKKPVSIMAPQQPEEPKPIGQTSRPSATVNPNFPMKKGSKGENVKALQNMILMIDKSLLPKFGADGDFGSETEAAVQKLLNKKSVDNKADIDTLNEIYRKKYQFVLNKPSTSVPMYDPFGFVKK